MKKTILFTMLMTSTFSNAYAMDDDEANNNPSNMVTVKNHTPKSGDGDSNGENKDPQILINSIRTEISVGEWFINKKLAKKGVETVVLVVGETGVGKSTLLNYLSGKPLSVQHRKDKGLYLDLDKGVKGMKIGHEDTSETTIPNAWHDKLTKTLYFDCAGFLDTKGALRDIANAFSLNKLLTSARNIKILFVFSEDSVVGKALPFKDTLQTLTGLFKDQEELKKSVSCVFTKQSTIQDIRFKLSALQLTSPESQDFVEYFAKNGSRISVFPNPSSYNSPARENNMNNSMVPSEYRDNILKNIKDSTLLNSPTVKISVSKNSRLILRDLKSVIDKETEDYIEKAIAPSIEKHYDNIVTQRGSKSSDQVSQELLKIRSKFMRIMDNNNHNTFIEDIDAFKKEFNVSYCIDKLKENKSYLDFFFKIDATLAPELGRWKAMLNSIKTKLEVLPDPSISTESRERVLEPYSTKIDRWYDIGFGWREKWSDGNWMIKENRNIVTFSLMTKNEPKKIPIAKEWESEGGRFQRQTYCREH